MNKHTKLAIFVAPFLALGGYIAADFFVEEKAQDKRAFELKPHGHCDVLNQGCILKAGDFQINVFDKNGKTTVNSTFPLDTATIFIVDNDDKATQYPLGMVESPYYWHTQTDLRDRVANKGDSQKMRVIATIKGGQYFAEFYTQTTK